MQWSSVHGKKRELLFWRWSEAGVCIPSAATFLRPQINLNSLALVPRLEISAPSICYIIRFHRD
uniref:Uncharacterized protein n=1 Tax=Setaria italica TaxID=4555 RepID=K4AHS3_SETIT